MSDKSQTTDETDHLLASPANAERLRRSIAQTTRDAERIGWLLSSAGADLVDSRNALLAGDLDDALEWISQAGATITELKEFTNA